MPQYRVTVFTEYGSSGPSETWISKANVSAANGLAQINKLLELRTFFAPQSMQFSGARLGVYGQRRQSVLVFPGQTEVDFLGGKVGLSFEGGLAQTDDTDVPLNYGESLKVRVAFQGGRSAQRYIAGVPRGIVVNARGGIVLANVPRYRDRLQTYFAELVNFWGIKARNVGDGFGVLVIQGWRNRATDPKILGAVINTVPDPLVVEGERVSVQGVRRKQKGSLSYNGQYFVDSVEAGPGAGKETVWLRNTVDGDASSIKLPGTLQRVAFTVASLDSLTASGVRTHKRGRPTLAPVGRRKTRASLDP